MKRPGPERDKKSPADIHGERALEERGVVFCPGKAVQLLNTQNLFMR